MNDDLTPISHAAVLEQRYRSRLSLSLDDLAGPERGTVQEMG